jgi:hypothetical protein
VRRLADDGFLVEVDEKVALRDLRLDAAGKATDVRECRADGRCRFVSELLVPDQECEPADGCATVDSDSGALRAVHVATLLHRPPAHHHLYQLRSDREIAAISDPARVAAWDGRSDYLLVSFAERPPAYTTLRLTITYADGGTDQLTMNFEIPMPAAARTAGFAASVS